MEAQVALAADGAFALGLGIGPCMANVMDTVAREQGGVRFTSGITRMSPPGAAGGGGEARGVPHLRHATRR